MARNASALAESLKRTLGSIQIDSKLIDLGNTPHEITRLTASIKRLELAIANSKAVAQLGKEAQILQKQLRHKRELLAGMDDGSQHDSGDPAQPQ